MVRWNDDDGFEAMSTDDQARNLAQLTQVLDVHGARAERWPDELRSELLAFIEQDSEGAKLLAQARALDELLGAFPAVCDSAPLERRILAAASVMPQKNGRIDLLAAYRRKAGSRALVRYIPERPSEPERRIWPELAVLAASLFLGLMIGLSGQAIPALQNIAVVADGQSGLGAIAGLLFDTDGGAGQGAL
jgi:hypothetical protein